jgi:mannose-6-phosphate isomerase-like protein (cupin superfamily)
MSRELSSLTRQSVKIPMGGTLSRRASCRLIMVHPEHIHRREDEAFYLLEGEFEIECGWGKVQRESGYVCTFAKGLPHRFQNLSDSPGRLLCVQSPSGIEEFFEHMSLLVEAGPPDLIKDEGTGAEVRD